MAANDDTYYKSITEEINCREKQERSFLDESLNLREKCTTAMVLFQDLVHPQKWIVLEEIRKQLQDEAENLKETREEETENVHDLNNDENENALLKVSLNQIDVIIKKSEDFLETNQKEFNA